MGLFDWIKGIYYGIEEKYYGVLDKVNEKLPVYDIVDPIDRVVPSLILFSLIFLVALAAGGAIIIGTLLPSFDDSLTVSVEGPDAKPIAGASVTFLKKGEALSSTKTDEFGAARQRGLAKDDEIEARVEAEGYLSDAKTVKIFELPQGEKIKLEKESEAFSVKTIRLLDALGQSASGSFTLKFRCSNAFAAAIRDVKIDAADRGTANVRVPNNCDRLSMDVTDSAEFREVSGERITGEDHTVYLKEEEASDSKIIVNVADSSGTPVDGIQAELFKYSELVNNPDVGPLDVEYTSSGQAVFPTSPGSYAVKIYDSGGRFGEQTSGRISLAAGKTETVSLVVKEEIRGKIKVKVVDKKSSAAVSGAKVKFVFASDESELATITTGSGGEGQVNVSRDAEYRAYVNHGEYQQGKASGLRISENTVTIQLEKCTPGTCGGLRVKVTDQDDKPITGATVVLYNASTNFISKYDSRRSDINGIAKFNQVSPDKYYAFAFKEGFSGRSDAKDFNPSAPGTEKGEANLTVKMEVGEGTVVVNVKDSESRPVPFARVGLFDARTEQLIGSDITDSNGVKQFDSLRANRRIFIVVSKQDEAVYANYTTAKRPIIVAGTQTFDVTLEKPILKDSIELEFLGLYAQDGKRAQNVKAGSDYTARFRLLVPEEKDYRSAGVHIRTGSDTLMEKDELFIKEVNMPRAAQVKATRFEGEKSGINEEDYGTTAADAKWVNARLQKPAAGIYELEATVGVKESASIGDKLELSYRAWGELDGKTDRFPKDDTITKELYSNTKQEIFQVGVVTLCDEDFCFTATITDKGTDPSSKSSEAVDLIESVSDTYNARVFNPYKLQFIISNNSQTRVHNNANLRIGNADSSIKFFDYKFIDSETKQKEGVVNGFEFPRLVVGDLRPKNSVRLEADFTPQKAVNGIVGIRLVSDQAVVFEKNLTIVVSSPRELEVEIEPASVYPSGVQNDVAVTVKDKSDGIEIEQAIVRLKDKRGNIVDFVTTGKDGKAALTIPGQKPGEKLKLEVEKINYNVKVVELEVSDKLLEISPSQLGIGLNTKDKAQSEDKLAIRNLAPYELKIKDISLKGNFKKLIDTAKVRNWLESSYRGMVIEPDAKQEISVRTFLSQDAQQLSKRTTLDGELVIIASNFGQEWVFKVPAKIAVGLGEEVDNPACLIVTKSEWVTSTSGTPKRTELQIQNNCTVGGKPVALQNLEAKVTWKTNQLGEYSLNIGPDQATLRPGYFRLLLGTIQPEQSLTAILSFTPFGGINGTGEADIVIEATNPLDDEDQVLQNTIKTKITSINLGQCLTYDKERLSINQGESGTITVTATELCGEKVDFAISTDLVTSPRKEFSLQPGQNQKIEVFAEKNYPGQYGIFLSPKFSSDKKEQLEKNLKVIISGPGCWQLSKYEFDIYDNPKNEFDGFDIATLTNTCVEKPVPVKVNTKDWLDAAQDGLFWGLASMGMVMLTNAVDPNTDVWGRCTDPKTGEPCQQKQDLDSLKKRRDDLDKQITSKEKEQAAKAANDPERKKTQAELDKLKSEKAAVEDKYNKLLKQQPQKGTAGESTEKKAGAQGGKEQTYTEEELKLLEGEDAAGTKQATTPKTEFNPGPGLAIPPDEHVKSTPLPPVGQGSVTKLTPGTGVDPFTLLPGEYVYETANKTWYRYSSVGTTFKKESMTRTWQVEKLEELAKDLPNQAVINPISGNGDRQVIVEPNSAPTPAAVETTLSYTQDGYRLVSIKDGDAYWVDPAGNKVTDDATLRRLDSEAFGGTGKIALPTTPYAVLPPIQALAPGYGGSSGSGSSGAKSSYNPFVGGAAQAAGGGIAGGLLQGGSGIVRMLFGTSPWASGVLGFLAGTVISYMGQEKEQTFTILAKDAELKNVTVVQGAAATEKPDKDIRLTAEGLGQKDGGAPSAPQPLANNADLISQGLETIRLIFANATGFTTTPERPKTPYPHLKIEGQRHKYKDKVYDKKDFVNEKGGFLGFFDQPTLDKAKTKLEEEAPQKLEQRFRLEFNSVPPQIEKVEPIGLLNCQDGTRLGKTGADALPKVRFAWTWNDIKENECNEDNPNGIYCDATQFSIALLRKINAIDQYVSTNSTDFVCPSSLEDKPAESEIGSFDIGVESLSTVKKGTEVEVIARIKNTNPGEIDTTTTIKLLKPQGSGEIACAGGPQRVIVAAGGESEAKCTFKDLAQGLYSARAEIVPRVSCANCEDIAATNSLSKNFFAGESGLQQCEPFSTTRLAEFLQASGKKNDKVVNMVKFNARLMADGYSSDFQRDFDLAQAETFFRTPDFYKNPQGGLGNYFKDPKLFSFDAYSQPDFTLPGPGTYSVAIDITFDDKSWQLFDAKGNPKAKITVRLEKLKGAEPDSPFYYLPLNGLVGQKDGRVGYGVNFAGDSIFVDNSSTPLRTVEIAGSAPIENGVLQVTTSKNFRSMQVDNRGVVAKLTRTDDNPSLLFQPSNATPVILQVDKKSGDDAYAIYEPAIDGDAVDVGQQLTLWNGIGASCRSFDDTVMSQQQFVPDTHGISTRCALVGPNQRSKYALEFCGDPVNYGSAFYETVFYTPQGSNSYIQLTDVASDSATFISGTSTGTRVALNGNGVTAKINSIQDVFNMVKSEHMCITGTSINAEFFWNPKKLFATLEKKEEAAINACITAKPAK